MPDTPRDPRGLTRRGLVAFGGPEKKPRSWHGSSQLGRPGFRPVPGFELATLSTHAPLSIAQTSTADSVSRPPGPRVVRVGGRRAQGRLAGDRRAERGTRNPVRARGRGTPRAVDRRGRLATACRARPTLRGGGAGRSDRETRYRRS